MRWDFVLAIVMTQKEIPPLARTIGKHTSGDAIVWFAYLKGTSKRYRCDFNRDTVWIRLTRWASKPCDKLRSTRIGRHSVSAESNISKNRLAVPRWP
jgi:hypothetical protein